MNVFSDMLALCKIDNIDKQVKTIHKSLRIVTATLERHREIYNLFSTAIDQIEGSHWLYELEFDEAPGELAAVDSRVSQKVGESPINLKQDLLIWQQVYITERNELLLLCLISSISDKFISVTHAERSHS